MFIGSVMLQNVIDQGLQDSRTSLIRIYIPQNENVDIVYMISLIKKFGFEFKQVEDHIMPYSESKVSVQIYESKVE